MTSSIHIQIVNNSIHNSPLHLKSKTSAVRLLLLLKKINPLSAAVKQFGAKKRDGKKEVKGKEELAAQLRVRFLAFGSGHKKNSRCHGGSGRLF